MFRCLNLVTLPQIETFCSLILTLLFIWFIIVPCTSVYDGWAIGNVCGSDCGSLQNVCHTWSLCVSVYCIRKLGQTCLKQTKIFWGQLKAVKSIYLLCVHVWYIECYYTDHRWSCVPSLRSTEIRHKEIYRFVSSFILLLFCSSKSIDYLDASNKVRFTFFLCIRSAQNRIDL